MGRPPASIDAAAEWTIWRRVIANVMSGSVGVLAIIGGKPFAPPDKGIPDRMNRRLCLGALLGVGATLSAEPVAAQSVRKAWPARMPTPPLELPAIDAAPWRLTGERGHP